MRWRTYFPSHSKRLNLNFEPSPTISPSLYTLLLAFESRIPTYPLLAAVFASRLNDGTLTGVEDAVCRSSKLGLTLTTISLFAPCRSAARRFLNASFLYSIFDLLFFLLGLRLEVSSSDGGSELEMLSKRHLVPVGGMLVDGGDKVGARG